jgi:methylmalonyl-CoA/ethylmalonyl-CoA epimerase
MSNERGFRIQGINHLGIAPKDFDASKRFFCEILGLSSLGEEVVLEQRTLTHMIRSSEEPALPNAEPRLELLAPQDGSQGSPIAQFLEKKGSGIHHVALRVDHVERAIAFLKSKGVRMVDDAPRDGAHHTKIAFVHPQSTGGILVELVEEQ